MKKSKRNISVEARLEKKLDGLTNKCLELRHENSALKRENEHLVDVARRWQSHWNSKEEVLLDLREKINSLLGWKPSP